MTAPTVLGTDDKRYVARLVQTAADHWRVHPDAICEGGRAMPLVYARWAIMRVLHERGWSSGRIGLALGRIGVGSTVRHARLKSHFQDEEVEILAAVLREVPR